MAIYNNWLMLIRFKSLAEITMVKYAQDITLVLPQQVHNHLRGLVDIVRVCIQERRGRRAFSNGSFWA